METIKNIDAEKEGVAPLPELVKESPDLKWDADGYAGSAYVREDGPYNRIAYGLEKRMHVLVERFKKDGLAEALFKAA